MSASPVSAAPQSSVQAIPGTVERLRATFAAGRTQPEAWRREQLKSLKAMLTDHGDEFVDAMRADLHKPELEAWADESDSTRGEA